MARRSSRRGFLRQAAGGGAGLVLLGDALSARSYAANAKVNVALIGVGGRGTWFVNTMPKLSNVVALCDVNEKKATVAHRKYPDTPKFHDFRVMIDKQKDIEAVVVATPDHTHAVASAAAIKAGKHVYVEKPMTRTVYEARAVRELAKKHQVATSMGNQGTASGQFRRAIELIRDGTIGEIKDVRVWNNGGGPSRKETPKDTAKVPPYLKWDLWLGPAPFRPFHPKWMAWHGWREFGTGQLGNWASHSANLAFMALRVDSLWHADPSTKPRVRVEAKVSEINEVSFPRWERISYEIPRRGELPPITFTWHNGGRAPGMRDELEALMGDGLDWGDKKEKKWRDHAGALIIGTKGKIHATGHNATFRLLPEDKFKDVDRSRPQQLDRSLGHERDWLAACRGGKPAWAHFDYAGPLDEFLMLGNVATQFEGVLDYDPLECRIVNNAEADKALRPVYREGWSL